MGNWEVPHVFEKKRVALSLHKTGIRSRESRSQKDMGKHGFPREREPKASVEHQRVAVPSAALSARRAYVPRTVSFTAIRSHAPCSTSSNVRAGYGSML